MRTYKIGEELIIVDDITVHVGLNQIDFKKGDVVMFCGSFDLGQGEVLMVLHESVDYVIHLLPDNVI